ncbi:MAG: LemA family protein [Candidatus Omnitrophica bacterium]|nr:LemA family protein [Candidatus Omnitrophota bacterium]
MGIGLWMVLAVVAILVLWVIGLYNGLVGARNQVRNSWSQIDVQLKRRHDLIPNLIETVKGYVQHERGTLENLTQARSQAMNATTVGDKARAEAQLSGALGRLLAVVENYPDLKANTNFLSLQEELSSTENRIAFARQNYNDQVLSYNNKIQMFPSNVIATSFHFKAEEYFELEDQAQKEVPKVKFS